MKRTIRSAWPLPLGLAVLLAMPLAAVAQEWEYDEYHWYNPADWFGEYGYWDRDYDYDFWEDDYEYYGEDYHGSGYYGDYRYDRMTGEYDHGWDYGDRYDYYTEDWYEDDDFDEWYLD